MDRQIIIETDALTKIYGRQTAVDRLTLQIHEGEIFGFLGPNGAGKTTTILMLMGLTVPSSGKVRVLGMDPVRNPIPIKAKVGYLQENMGFYPDLDARQMLRYIAALNAVPKETAEKRIAEALQVVGLDQEALKKIGAYSRGMRQRLGIAELLIKDSRIAFLDEPTLGLDPDATHRMISLIEALSRDRNITILISSHQLHQIQRICHRVGIMIKGKMVALGPMETLAREKFGVGKETFTLEEIYMKYFQEN